MLLPGLLIALLIHADTRVIVESVLADAFIQVSAFVAATLALYYGLSKQFNRLIPNNAIAKHPTIELVGSAFLGALPGCGGAIIVITQFTKGKLSFGSVVAVLTSTMGDAAFLLLAQQPTDGALIMLIGFLVGVISGWITNIIHHENFLQPKSIQSIVTHLSLNIISTWQQKINAFSLQFWRLMLVPIFIIGSLVALQINPNQLIGLPPGTIEIIGAVAGFITVFLWSISSIGNNYETVTSEESGYAKSNWMMKVALDTQFVTSWVVAAFLVFELAIFYTGFDIATSFSQLGSLAVLLAYCLVVGHKYWSQVCIFKGQFHFLHKLVMP